MTIEREALILLLQRLQSLEGLQRQLGASLRSLTQAFSDQGPEYQKAYQDHRNKASVRLRESGDSALSPDPVIDGLIQRLRDEP